MARALRLALVASAATLLLLGAAPVAAQDVPRSDPATDESVDGEDEGSQLDPLLDAVDPLTQWVDDAQQVTEDGAQQIVDGVEEGADILKQEVSEDVGTLTQGAEDLGDLITQGANDVGEQTTSAAEPLTDWAEDARTTVAAGLIAPLVSALEQVRIELQPLFDVFEPLFTALDRLITDLRTITG